MRKRAIDQQIERYEFAAKLFIREPTARNLVRRCAEWHRFAAMNPVTNEVLEQNAKGMLGMARCIEMVGREAARGVMFSRDLGFDYRRGMLYALHLAETHGID